MVPQLLTPEATATRKWAAIRPVLPEKRDLEFDYRGWRLVVRPSPSVRTADSSRSADLVVGQRTRRRGTVSMIRPSGTLADKPAFH